MSLPLAKFAVAALGVLSVSITGFSLASRRPPPNADTQMRVGVLGGPESEVLEFVAARHPELRIAIERHDETGSLHRALLDGRLAAGSFETLPLHGKIHPLLASAGTTLTLPFALYSREFHGLSAIAAGSTIAVPEEPVAQGRALLVLFYSGLVSYAEELGPDARLGDISQNPRQLRFIPTSQVDLWRALDTASLAVLDYSTAARLGLAPARNALTMEDAFSPFAQVLTVRADALDSPRIRRLVEAYHSDEVKDFVLTHFSDSVRRPW